MSPDATSEVESGADVRQCDLDEGRLDPEQTISANGVSICYPSLLPFSQRSLTRYDDFRPPFDSARRVNIRTAEQRSRPGHGRQFFLEDPSEQGDLVAVLIERLGIFDCSLCGPGNRMAVESFSRHDLFHFL